MTTEALPASSPTDIMNIAAAHCGVPLISDPTEGTPQAQALNARYPNVLRAMLRSYTWTWAAREALLAAVVGPASSPLTYSQRKYYFKLPADYVRLAPVFQEEAEFLEQRDWVMEGKGIASNEAGPLKIRYIAYITEVPEFDALFVEAFGAELAAQVCEKLTNSRDLARIIQGKADQIVKEARRVGAIEQPKPQKRPREGSWFSSRR